MPIEIGDQVKIIGRPDLGYGIVVSPVPNSDVFLIKFGGINAQARFPSSQIVKVS